MLTMDLTIVLNCVYVCGLNFVIRNFTWSHHADDFFEMTPPFHSSFSYKCQMFYFAEPVINAVRYRPRADY